MQDKIKKKPYLQVTTTFMTLSRKKVNKQTLNNYKRLFKSWEGNFDNKFFIEVLHVNMSYIKSRTLAYKSNVL